MIRSAIVRPSGSSRDHAKTFVARVVPLSHAAIGRHHNHRIQGGFQQQAEPIALSHQARKVPF